MSIGDCTRTPEAEQALQVVVQLARLVSPSADSVGAFFVRNYTLYEFTATEAAAAAPFLDFSTERFLPRPATHR
jgi:hypothetical protein